MSDLSPQLRQLVSAGKRASAPTDADAARVTEALRARLGDAALLGAETGHVAAGSSAGSLFGKIGLVSVAGLAILGGALFFTARNHRVVTSASPALASVAAARSAAIALAPSAVAPSLPSAVASDPESAQNAKVDRADVRTAASHHARDNLSEEVAILSRAETDLHSGKPESALKLLNEHERKFSNGLLAEERIAARVQALCALGRNAEADAQLARLSPKSVQGARARQACGSGTGN